MQKAIRRLDVVFSRYIRERDCGVGFGRCICCGGAISASNSDNGHYIPRRHMATRFNEKNCNACCKECNQFKAGNLEAYERGLERKYGTGTVYELISLSRETKHYSKHEIKEMIKYYNQKTKEL